MSSALDHLLENNRRWAAEQTAAQPDYFSRHADKQTPSILWIGCSDSRVPPNQIVGLPPGEIFVHRNIANMVIHSDLSCQSVLQFAVGTLGVQHIIVCGHYACGGVNAALADTRLELLDHWLRHIKDVQREHANELAAADATTRGDLLAELNVVAQLRHVAATRIVQDSWRNGKPLTLHGWIYNIRDGLLKKLKTQTANDSA